MVSNAAVTAAGKLGTRALLTLTAVAGAVLNSPSERIKQQYMSWLWNLLLSPVGRALVKLVSSDVEDAEELCLAEVTTPPWQLRTQSVLWGTSANVSIAQWLQTSYA
jgi:hypothetical protein